MTQIKVKAEWSLLGNPASEEREYLATSFEEALELFKRDLEKIIPEGASAGYTISCNDATYPQDPGFWKNYPVLTVKDAITALEVDIGKDHDGKGANKRINFEVKD